MNSWETRTSWSASLDALIRGKKVISYFFKLRSQIGGLTLFCLFLNFVSTCWALLSDRQLYLDGTEFWYFLASDGSAMVVGHRYLHTLFYVLPSLLYKFLIHWSPTMAWQASYFVLSVLIMFIPFAMLLLSLHLLDRYKRTDLNGFVILSFSFGSMLNLLFPVCASNYVVTLVWPLAILLSLGNFRKAFEWIASLSFLVALTFSHESIAIFFILLSLLVVVRSLFMANIKLIPIFVFLVLAILRVLFVSQDPSYSSKSAFIEYFFLSPILVPYLIMSMLFIFFQSFPSLRPKLWMKVFVIQISAIAYLLFFQIDVFPIPKYIYGFWELRVYGVGFATLLIFAFLIKSQMKSDSFKFVPHWGQWLITTSLVMSLTTDLIATNKWNEFRSILRSAQTHAPDPICNTIEDIIDRTEIKTEFITPFLILDQKNPIVRKVALPKTTGDFLTCDQFKKTGQITNNEFHQNFFKYLR